MIDERFKVLLAALERTDSNEIIIRLQISHLDSQDERIVAELKALFEKDAIDLAKLTGLDAIIDSVKRIELAETEVYGILEQLWYSKAKVARDLHTLLAAGTVVVAGNGRALTSEQESQLAAEIVRMATP